MKLSRRGFTLLEVVVGAALLSLVMVGVYVVLIQGTRSMGQGTQRLDAVSDLSRVVEALRRDARSIYWKADNPITVTGSVPDLTLSFHVVVGVTTEGRPVVVPVEWKYHGDSEGGSLVRVYSPGSGERVKKYFSGQLEVFDVIRYESSGEIIVDDSQTPAYLGCDLIHKLGDSIRLTLFLNSRYQVSEARNPALSRWIPNYRLSVFDPAAPVITAAGGSTAAVVLNGPATVSGGAVVTTGEVMSQAL